ncbi:universal stress protein [Syntrophorhabdus aromaticivorans]|uniref:Universal stress protein n=1 Tax=Syntrophorhabdus aromaticivorans TaxID=328301 RepID=A0A351U3K7_9BACT|nr:universal stress protein [Syntrophorhabdus aromaticivorans]NLW36709.1 universal stress protein [Syntrophorhabdus aromaticivorans]HBA54538.1 universal stress protein [Syntrophorhabdus aromaticivorans]
MLNPTKILVPTDFSGYSDKALRQALDIAKQYKAKVYVVHVLHGKNPYDTTDGTIPSYYEDLEKQMIDGAARQVQEQIDKFPQAKEVEIFSEVVSGNTAEAILAEEKSKGVDLIVIASLGRSGIAKYLIGSVARNVLKGATCPVLLTK